MRIPSLLLAAVMILGASNWNSTWAIEPIHPGLPLTNGWYLLPEKDLLTITTDAGAMYVAGYQSAMYLVAMTIFKTPPARWNSHDYYLLSYAYPALDDFKTQQNEVVSRIRREKSVSVLWLLMQYGREKAGRNPAEIKSWLNRSGNLIGNWPLPTP